MANVLEQKEIELDGDKYFLKVFPATVGLELQHRLMTEGQTPAFVKELVMKGCTKKGGVQISDKVFDSHFAGRYGHLYRLLEEIMKHNFEDVGPNVESDSEEK